MNHNKLKIAGLAVAALLLLGAVAGTVTKITRFYEVHIGGTNFVNTIQATNTISATNFVAGTNFVVGTEQGIAATVNVLVAGSTTNRMVWTGGILVSNITEYSE